MFVLFVLALLGMQVDRNPAQVVQSTEEADVQVKPDDLRSPRLPPGVSLDRELSPEDVVAVALWNSSSFHAALTELGLARADLLEAGLLRNPNLSLLFPVGPKPFELALTFPVEVFWQRPRRIAAAKLNLEVVSRKLEQYGLDLARDAKIAHLEVALARERFTIASDAARLKERIAELTARRFEAGDISRSELARAQTEAIVARAAASDASDSLASLQERLRWVIGLRGYESELRVTPVSQNAEEAPALDLLLETAYSARPDLRAAELSVQAAAARAGWERRRVLALGVVLSTKEVGAFGARTGPGVSLDIPVFNRNQGAVRRADLEVETAAWRYLVARDQVETEVRMAYAQGREARENLRRIREQIIPALQRNADLAQASYRNGDISYFDALIAAEPLLRARLGESDALGASRRAAILLERSLGRKP
jgi:cobalt-zinc-cadmium efflux system outer membrane protein